MVEGEAPRPRPWDSPRAKTLPTDFDPVFTYNLNIRLYL